MGRDGRHRRGPVARKYKRVGMLRAPTAASTETGVRGNTATPDVRLAGPPQRAGGVVFCFVGLLLLCKALVLDAQGHVWVLCEP